MGTLDQRAGGSGVGAQTRGVAVQPAVLCTTGHVTHALTSEGCDASEDGTGRGTPIVIASGQANAEVTHGIAPSLTLLHEAPITVVGTLDAHDATKWGSHQWEQQNKCMVQVGRTRRLTPLECERLMSWPDQWTAFGVKEDGTAYAMSDTARYRLCGNGVGSVVSAWIARRLVWAEKHNPFAAPRRTETR
jgi:DNA (cytosine-5)-methyltransferase 1